MKRLAILTAGGDTPALNATIYGAVTRANHWRIEVVGLLRGFNSLFNERLPHVHLNPLFSPIPELDPVRGGSLLGSSRKYIGKEHADDIQDIGDRLRKLGVEGLICVGGDGTLNGLQPLCEQLPTVLAPKTIDNDLGLNYPHEADDWERLPHPDDPEDHCYVLNSRRSSRTESFDFSQMINYATPGYATAVYVSAGGVGRIRTTAESHRRVAIIEVMGRHSGYIALGSAYGQPDIILLPERPLDIQRLSERVKELYDLQQNVVIVCGEGIVGADGCVLGDQTATTDPAGNVRLSGAAESLRALLMQQIGDRFFQNQNRNIDARSAIFTRKVGHTQRGGRPVQFDRFYAAQLGGKAVDMLLEGKSNSVATLQWSADNGFRVSSHHANEFRDRWGLIHARQVHKSFYDEELMHISPVGVRYLLPIFTTAIGADDTEHIRQTLFDSSHLFQRYHSINTDMGKRIEYLDD